MNDKKPNAICRKCGKPYFVCNYCTRMANFRTFVCSQECFEGYTKNVLDARKENNDKIRVSYANYKTSRTDLTPEQYNNLMKKPIQNVLADVRAEFKSYFDEDPSRSIMDVIDIINREIDMTTQKEEVADDTVEPVKKSENFLSEGGEVKPNIAVNKNKKKRRS